MGKYLVGFLNLIIVLAITFIGLLFSLNILVAGFIFFPYVVTGVDQYLISNPVPVWWTQFVPGALPTVFLLVVLYFTFFIMFKVIKLIKKVDVEKIISAMQRDFRSQKKEVK